MNWKLVSLAGVALMFSGVLAGLLDSIATSPLQSDSERLASFLAAMLGHFVFYTAVFSWIGFRQEQRPVIHAVLAYILATVLTLAIWAGLKAALSLPGPIEPRPLVLQAIDWTVTVFSAIVGLGLGRRLACFR